MAASYRTTRFLVAGLLAASLLRSFIPAGYMPAAPGQGLLFELCHESVPSAVIAALDDHAHDDHAHAHHTADEAHGTDSGCAVGHILSLAFIDSVATVDILEALRPVFTVVEPSDHYIATSARVFLARAPPAS